MKVFVYGSLKAGYWNHMILKENDAKFLGKSVLWGYSLYHIANYPGMVKSPNPFEKVYGETYDVDDDTLELLDSLESEGYLYKRQLLTVVKGVIPIKAYSYIYLLPIEVDTKKVYKNDWKGRPKRLNYIDKK